jgi:hypothetical protein
VNHLGPIRSVNFLGELTDASISFWTLIDGVGYYSLCTTDKGETYIRLDPKFSKHVCVKYPLLGMCSYERASHASYTMKLQTTNRSRWSQLISVHLSVFWLDV